MAPREERAAPPFSCSGPEKRPHTRPFFLLFHRRLAEEGEPWRLAPGRISVSERPSVSNRANLVDLVRSKNSLWIQCVVVFVPCTSCSGCCHQSALTEHP